MTFVTFEEIDLGVKLAVNPAHVWAVHDADMIATFRGEDFETTKVYVGNTDYRIKGTYREVLHALASQDMLGGSNG